MSSGFRISIGVNIILVGILAVLLCREEPAAPFSVAPPARPVSVRPETLRTVAVTREVQPKSAGPNLSPAAITQLEQLGISHDTLVSVLLEDLKRRSAQRVLELQKAYAPRLVPDREMRELVREDDAEQIRELKTALGDDGYLAWDKQETLHMLNRARPPGDDLPMSTDEAKQAYRLQKDFDQNNRKLQMALEDGGADRADVNAQQVLAQQALDRELEKLLGKPRFDELRGIVDPITEAYRTFGDLNPTPDQAKEVVQVEGDYRDREAALAKRLNQNPGDAADVTAKLTAVNDAREEILRQIFGPEAYDNLKRQTDPTDQTLQ
jgi:hypothetical protein